MITVGKLIKLFDLTSDEIFTFTDLVKRMEVSVLFSFLIIIKKKLRFKIKRGKKIIIQLRRKKKKRFQLDLN